MTTEKLYLLDAGLTGYAQVLEEKNDDGDLIKNYTLGDDVLADNGNYLLYDGHGNTRLLADTSGTIAETYNYDAYGKNLFDTSNVSTNMLYSGEQFDPNLQMQYLRARYYDQNNGTFNRLDPFNDNMGDPQSLHKYAYTHNDPVNGIDPSGEWTLNELMITIKTSTFLQTFAIGAIRGAATNAIFSLIVKLYRAYALNETRDLVSGEYWSELGIETVNGAITGGLGGILSNLKFVAKIRNLKTVFDRKFLRYIGITSFVKGVFGTSSAIYNDFLEGKQGWSKKKIFSALLSSIFFSAITDSSNAGLKNVIGGNKLQNLRRLRIKWEGKFEIWEASKKVRDKAMKRLANNISKGSRELAWLDAIALEYIWNISTGLANLIATKKGK